MRNSIPRGRQHQQKDEEQHDVLRWHQQHYHTRATRRVQQGCIDEDLLKKAAVLLISKFESESRPLFLEKTSVYGAGILIPQLTRSAGCPKAMIILTFQVYFFVFLNFVVQTMLLAALQKEENVMDPFSGQMYLCDLGGRSIDACPHNPSCLGPGGTMISGSRLYDYASWRTRGFLQSSLKMLFRDQEDEIEDLVDPGEYGAQSREIRWLCGFIFMMEVMNELMLILNMLYLFYAIPTANESWIQMVKDEDDPGSSYRLSLRIAGMPLRWKCLNVVLILLPKMMLWCLTATAGITFLMETSDLADMIVNAVSLCFILQLDECICVNLMSDSISNLLADIGDYENKSSSSDSHERRHRNATVEATSYNAFHSTDSSLSKEDLTPNKFTFRTVALLCPFHLCCALLLTVVFVAMYYSTRCEWKQDGGWFASRPVFEPKVTTYSPLNTYFPYFFPIEYMSEPFWQMPELT